VAGFCCVVGQKAVGVLSAKTLPATQVHSIRRTKAIALDFQAKNQLLPLGFGADSHPWFFVFPVNTLFAAVSEWL
jgi:hypothetical protein